MTATVYHLPPPKVRRALEELATVGALAVEGWRSDDRELLRGYQRQAVCR